MQSSLTCSLYGAGPTTSTGSSNFHGAGAGARPNQDVERVGPPAVRRRAAAICIRGPLPAVASWQYVRPFELLLLWPDVPTQGAHL